MGKVGGTVVRATSRFVDRGPRRPRSRRFYPRGYRSSNPDTTLLGLAAVVVGGVVLVVFLPAVSGRSRGYDTRAADRPASVDIHPAAMLPTPSGSLLTGVQGAGSDAGCWSSSPVTRCRIGYQNE